MTSEQIARDIADLEGKAAAMRRQLDDLAVATRPEISSAVVKWIDLEVSRRVEGSSGIFLALSDDQIAGMKAKVAAARDAAIAVVRAQLAEQGNWPHRVGPRPQENSSTDREPFFQAVFRDAICELGPVLDEFGLTSTPKGQVAAWKRVNPGVVRYVINPGFDSRDSPTVSAYHSAQTELGDLEKKIAAARSALEKATATERWKSA